MNYLDMAPVTAIQIKNWTSQDPNLSKVRHYVQNGWPCSDDIDKDLLWFYQHKDELSTEDGCLLWGCRIIIPKPGQAPLLSQVHETHPGISRMKSLSRRYFWWPGLDVDLENLVKSCEICCQTRKTPPKAHLLPWEWPEKPWTRVHIDYAGPSFIQKLVHLNLGTVCTTATSLVQSLVGKKEKSSTEGALIHTNCNELMDPSSSVTSTTS